jgi:hypothetical protein
MTTLSEFDMGMLLRNDYERLTTILQGWHWLAFAALFLVRAGPRSASQAQGKKPRRRFAF